MRRLCLTLLVSAILAPAALAAPRAAGDGTFSGKAINGTVFLSARGAIWGQVDSGTLLLTDPDPTDGFVKVSGYDKLPVTTDRGTVYTGGNLHFQVAGGTYRLYIVGTGIDFSAVGSGWARLDAYNRSTNPGKFAVGDDPWQPAPYFSTTIVFPVSTTALPFPTAPTP